MCGSSSNSRGKLILSSFFSSCRLIISFGVMLQVGFCKVVVVIGFSKETFLFLPNRDYISFAIWYNLKEFFRGIKFVTIIFKNLLKISIRRFIFQFSWRCLSIFMKFNKDTKNDQFTFLSFHLIYSISFFNSKIQTSIPSLVFTSTLSLLSIFNAF